MADEFGSQEPEVVEETTESHSFETQQPEPAAQDETHGINPVWEPIRQELGLQFETIRPTLDKVSKDYHEHVTKVNGQYEPWKQFDSDGVTPDQVRNAFGMLQRLNDNPEEIYQALGQFLEENGRLPKNANEAAQAVKDAEESAADEFLTDEQKQIKALQKQVEDFQALFTSSQEQAQQQAEAQQRERLQEQANAELEREITAFHAAHPNLSQEDWREIQQRQYFYALQGPEHIKSLEEVGQEYFALTERFRSAPRPNDTAPRLPGAGGTAPAGQTRDPSTFTREESQDALVALLQQGKQQ